jgi:hypothetical protein
MMRAMDVDALRPADARFPGVDRGAGHYESFYLKAVHPDGGRGLWIRHTVHKRPGSDPNGAVWCTYFDAGRGAPRAVKITLPAVDALPGGGIAVGESRLTLDGLTGSARAETLDASWELAFRGGSGPHAHLPYAWMYRAPIPRTKLVTLRQAMRVDGRLVLDGEELALDGWRGMVNHNWGSEHAERWIWTHGLGFAGCDDDTWLDLAIGRIKLGSWTTPWIANGQLCLDGEVHAIGGLPKVRGTEVVERADGASFTIPGPGFTVVGEVEAPKERFVGWEYADPDGPGHQTVNCSIATMRLRVERLKHQPRELIAREAAAYELGMRERDHGVPIQPFGDG